jgi:hypothetical protein
MAGFANVQQLVDAEVKGQSRFYTWRKTPSQVTTQGQWFDLALSPGNPAPKFWFDATPATAWQVKRSTDGGLFHGADVSPQKKYLRSTCIYTTTSTALPMTMILLDYLLYYPSMDDSTTDEQVMDNTRTLPRYTDGAGVQMMAVSVAGRTGGQTLTVKYTNSAGVSGRVSQTVLENSSAAVGAILTSQTATNGAVGPFIPLQDGDTGVRLIESVTMNGVDVGLFTLILVKPLATTQLRGIDAAVEKDYFLESAGLPEIKDDAFLNWVVLPNGSLSGTPIHGDIKVVWN